MTDHCNAIDLIIRKGRVGEVYNIGGHNEKSNLEVVKTILKALRSAYDYIFLDLPPVMSVADAAILAPLLDGYVMVVRNEITEYRAVADSLDQLRLAKAKVIGFVYNDADISGGNKYYHSYYKKD